MAEPNRANLLKKRGCCRTVNGRAYALLMERRRTIRVLLMLRASAACSGTHRNSERSNAMPVSLHREDAG